LASIEEANQVKREPSPENYLEQLHADFSSSASSKEAEARDLEDRMMLLRVEAAGLRHAAVGVREALDLYHREMARTKEFQHARDGEDQPAREAPYMSQQGPSFARDTGYRG